MGLALVDTRLANSQELFTKRKVKMSRCPSGIFFPSVGMEISIEIQKIKNLYQLKRLKVYCFLLKILLWSFLSDFFHTTSNADKINRQFSSGVKILRYFFQRKRFFCQFLQWGGGYIGSVKQERLQSIQRPIKKAKEIKVNKIHLT